MYKRQAKMNLKTILTGISLTAISAASCEYYEIKKGESGISVYSISCTETIILNKKKCCKDYREGLCFEQGKANFPEFYGETISRHAKECHNKRFCPAPSYALQDFDCDGKVDLLQILNKNNRNETMFREESIIFLSADAEFKRLKTKLGGEKLDKIAEEWLKEKQ